MNNNTIILTLQPTDYERSTLIYTMSAYNAAKNHILSVAREQKCFNKHKLSSSYYYELKNDFLLPAQLVVSAISTVVEDYKADKKIVEYDKFDSVFYDKRVISFRGLTRANLATTIGRLPIKFEFNRYIFWDNAPVQAGCAVLFKDGNSFTLYSVIA